MSVTLFETAAAAPSRRSMPFGGMANGNGEQRPRAKVWLNIGYEAGGKFINLPIGLPIDTMEPADARGQNVDWVKQRTAQNALLEAVQKLGLSLQPGQEQTLQLEVRVRRVNEELAVPADENEYAVDLGRMLVAAAAE